VQQLPYLLFMLFGMVLAQEETLQLLVLVLISPGARMLPQPLTPILRPPGQQFSHSSWTEHS
jgi:hypothetical protein